MPKITRTYSDIDLNFNRHPVTGDITKIYDDVDVKRALKTLVLMAPFDSYFHPEISSPISGMLFDILTPDTAQVIKKITTNLIENFEKRVTLYDIIVNTDNYHNLSIEIQYTMSNIPGPLLSLTVTLKRVR